MTRSLLGYGVLGGPVYVLIVLAQALTRPGFDLSRHDVSLLSNGPFGWIQVVNFLITGTIVILFALGLQRALAGGSGQSWVARLVALYGVGLIGAGVFIADPMNGFPIGTPAGKPETISAHGMLHIAIAGIGFLCLVAACMVLARRFAASRERRWMVFSITTGIVFLAAFVGLASGSSSPAVVIGFWIALLLSWGWTAALAVHFYRLLASDSMGTA